MLPYLFKRQEEKCRAVTNPKAQIFLPENAADCDTKYSLCTRGNSHSHEGIPEEPLWEKISFERGYLPVVPTILSSDNCEQICSIANTLNTDLSNSYARARIVALSRRPVRKKTLPHEWASTTSVLRMTLRTSRSILLAAKKISAIYRATLAIGSLSIRALRAALPSLNISGPIHNCPCSSLPLICILPRILI